MKKFFSIILSFLISVSFTACSMKSGEERFSKSFIDLFDTASSVIAYDKSQTDFNNHFNQFYKELKSYYELFDIYNNYGDLVNLKYLNDNASKEPVLVDEKIIDLLKFGKEVYNISGGKTNIAMGSVLFLWHDARENATENPDDAKLPDEKELEKASKHTDINNLVIDEEKKTVYFKDSKMKLDVGAIAKGFAVEKVCRFCTENGIWNSASISIGGNVKTIGYKNNDGKTKFNIGIENPDITSSSYLETLLVADGKSVVTSGDYQRYFVVDGKKYCHIIDPETLMPSDFVSAVSVITNDSSMGDALSTTLFNMSVEDGLKLVNSLEDTEAVWVDKNGKETKSLGFDNFVEK